ncbi:MAG: SprT-like domain-containing protein [Gammaproteobacteria bacterium]|nr:SprT-like domain-containing protein [Gammaproteobacteria bacterium]
MTELLEFRKAKITRAARKYKEAHGIEFELLFDMKGASAGQAKYIYATRKCTIRLNMGFIKHNFDEMLSQTFPHEVAHVMAVIKYGRAAKGHGAHWKEMMAKLGKRPDRLHRMDCSAVYEHKVYCDCQTHPVSKIMWNKVNRGAQRTCRKCNGGVTITPRPNQK